MAEGSQSHKQTQYPKELERMFTPNNLCQYPPPNFLRIFQAQQKAEKERTFLLSSSPLSLCRNQELILTDLPISQKKKTY